MAISLLGMEFKRIAGFHVVIRSFQVYKYGNRFGSHAEIVVPEVKGARIITSLSRTRYRRRTYETKGVLRHFYRSRVEFYHLHALSVGKQIASVDYVAHVGFLQYE